MLFRTAFIGACGRRCLDAQSWYIQLYPASQTAMWHAKNFLMGVGVLCNQTSAPREG